MGEEEPDRYVLFSNHRDAWGYGASDPSSGTAALMETARVLGNLHKSTGWRPRRTIVFASWAAEEYGMMGSIEWVHHHIQKLMDRAVAIINGDLCVFGDRLAPQASPILKARMPNDQIMKFERVWIMPRGLPGREEIRHAIFSPAKHNLYGGAALPGISDLLYGVEELEEQERAERLLELRKHLSDLMILFKQAASWLQPFDHL